MKKYFRLLLVVLFIPFFITKVHAAEPTLEDALACIKDNYTLSVTEREAVQSGLEYLVAEAIEADLAANGIDLVAMGYEGYAYVMPDDIYSGFYYIYPEGYEEEYEKNFTITYSNTGEKDEEAEATVQEVVEETEGEIVFQEIVEFDEIDTHEYQYYETDYLDDHIAEAMADYPVDYEWSGIGGGANYFSGGLVGAVHLFQDDVWYGTIGFFSAYNVRVFVPYIVEDVDSYVLDLLKTYLTSQGEEVDNLVIVDGGGIRSEDDEYYYGDIIILQDEGQEIEENVLVDSIYENIVLNPIDEEVQTELEEIASEKGYEETFVITDVETDEDLSKGLNYTFQVGEKYNGKDVLIISRKEEEEDEFFNPVVENGKVVHSVTELSLLGVFLPYVEETVEEEVPEENSEVIEETAAPVVIPATYSPYVYGEEKIVPVSDTEDNQIEEVKEPEEDKNKNEEKQDEKEEKPQNKAFLILILIALILGVIYFMYMGSRE